MQSSYIHTEENYKGYTIKIVSDKDPQNPRTEWENLGTMVCWHRRYNLGDLENNRPISENYSEPDYLFAEIAGIDRDSDYCMRIYDTHGHEALTNYLHTQACKKAVILPLYLYDHSGITISTSGFSDPWDSGQIGYIYILHTKIRKEYSWKQLNKKRLATIAENLKNEVTCYDDFLTGNVWGFTCGTEDDDSVAGSCWGFYGDEGIKDAMQEAKSDIDYHIKNIIKKHIGQVKTWIKNKVPLQNRKPLQLVA